MTPLTFLGGVFYSIDMLPEPWRSISLANPILYMVNGLRYGIVGLSDVPISHCVISGAGGPVAPGRRHSHHPDQRTETTPMSNPTGISYAIALLMACTCGCGSDPDPCEDGCDGGTLDAAPPGRRPDGRRGRRAGSSRCR